MATAPTTSKRICVGKPLGCVTQMSRLRTKAWVCGVYPCCVSPVIAVPQHRLCAVIRSTVSNGVRCICPLTSYPANLLLSCSCLRDARLRCVFEQPASSMLYRSPRKTKYLFQRKILSCPSIAKVCTVPSAGQPGRSRCVTGGHTG